MKKAEREQRQREQNSNKLVREIESFFQQRPEQDDVVRCINSEQHDWSILRRSRYPMHILLNAECPHICFKRTSEVPNRVWSDGSAFMAIWRP